MQGSYNVTEKSRWCIVGRLCGTRVPTGHTRGQCNLMCSSSGWCSFVFAWIHDILSYYSSFFIILFIIQFAILFHSNLDRPCDFSNVSCSLDFPAYLVGMMENKKRTPTTKTNNNFTLAKCQKMQRSWSTGSNRCLAGVATWA